MCSRSDARRKLRSSATAMKYLRCRKSIICIKYRCWPKDVLDGIVTEMKNERNSEVFQVADLDDLVEQLLVTAGRSGNEGER